MASLCRSAAISAVRSIARSASTRSTTLPTKSSPSRSATLFSRPLASALGSVESLRPLHSAVASARLISNIAVDSSCWSLLSQGLPLPL